MEKAKKKKIPPIEKIKIPTETFMNYHARFAWG